MRYLAGHMQKHAVPQSAVLLGWSGIHPLLVLGLPSRRLTPPYWLRLDEGACADWRACCFQSAGED